MPVIDVSIILVMHEVVIRVVHVIFFSSFFFLTVKSHWLEKNLL